MALVQPRLRLALLGALAALAAGGLVAFMIHGRGGKPSAPPPASQGGLVIDATGGNVGRIDAAKPLRCFVGGQLVGELTLKDCALRNGVASDALDVGVDATGNLAAGRPGAQTVTPLPPPGSAAAAPPSTPVAPAPPPVAQCLRYADNHWRSLPSSTTLNGCVQALFAGRCEVAGGASYGRWGQQTLRLVPGKIEISGDNHSFRTLAEQGAGCSIP